MLKQLKVHHREIAKLRFEGTSPQDIAGRMDMSVHTVNLVLRDPLCKSYLSGLQDRADSDTLNVRRELSKMNQNALDTLKYLLTQGEVPASVQLGAAKDVLDRNGFQPTQKHEHLHGHFTAEDVAKLRERAMRHQTAVSQTQSCQTQELQEPITVN